MVLRRGVPDQGTESWMVVGGYTAPEWSTTLSNLLFLEIIVFVPPSTRLSARGYGREPWKIVVTSIL